MAISQVINTLSLSKFMIVTFTRQKLTYLVMALIFAGGLWIRLHGISVDHYVIENEGGEYARLAENIFYQHAYIGTQEGQQLLFPPLYPLLISSLLWVIEDSEWAARLVSLFMGMLSFIPVYLTIRKIYTETAALIGTAFVAFHPYLIETSTSVLSEATYLFFMLWGIYWGLCALQTPTRRILVLGGMAWGFAYLTRTEGLVGLLVTVVLMGVAHYILQRKWRALLLNSCYLVAPFLLLALPYILFIYSATGHVRVENKSLIVYTISERMFTGMTYAQAALEIDDKLQQVGPELNNTAFILQAEGRVTISKLLTFLGHFYDENLKQIFRILAFHLTPYVMLILIPLGLFRRTWRKERIISELYLLALFAAQLLLLLSIAFIHDRYITSFLPILLIWAANGTIEIAEWLGETVQNMHSTFGQRYQVKLQAGITIAMALLVLALFFITQQLIVPNVTAQIQSAQRTAGLWLRAYAPGPKVIMATGTAPAYYSGGTWVPFPYTTDELRLAYIEQRNPAFLVLYGAIIEETRTDLLAWYQEGIPDARAKLIFRAGDTEIYRWTNTLEVEK